MCGIVGAFSPQSLKSTLATSRVEQLNQAQQHRGPDHEVVVSADGFVLGNTRLAIQDPTDAANQPFHSPDGRFTVVFNGEIYNFAELVRRHRLQVVTGCDGEVIPLLWQRLGPDCLNEFRGMFAVAVADSHDKRLFLARDPFGIKPLHWRRLDDSVIFASEPKPLWRLDRALPIDKSALADFLRFGAVRAGRSPFEGIEAIEPGQCVSFGPDLAPRCERMENPLAGITTTDHSMPLADALRDSVRAHLVSDVPTALLLSAGVDSTSLALAAKQLGQDLHCLTVTGVVDHDEGPQARATARAYGLSHQEVPARVDAKTVSHFFDAMQRPTIDGLNTFLVAAAVRDAGFKVALSGLGGDEALGGYSTTRLLRFLPLLRTLDLLPAKLMDSATAAVSRRLPGGGSAKADRLLRHGGPRTPQALVELQRELLTADVVDSLGLQGDTSATPVSQGRGYAAMAAAEVTRYLQPVLLQDADAFSMAVSVELRVPYVDRAFFNAAMQRRRLRGKPELVRQLNDPHLSKIVKRPKTGFALPMRQWLQDGVLADVVADARHPQAPVWDYLSRDIGLELLAGAKDNPRWSEPWAIASLDHWLRSL